MLDIHDLTDVRFYIFLQAHVYIRVCKPEGGGCRGIDSFQAYHHYFCSCSVLYGLLGGGTGVHLCARDVRVCAHWGRKHQGR